MAVRILSAIVVFSILLVAPLLSQPPAAIYASDARVQVELSFRWDEINLPLALVMNITNDEIVSDNKLATIQIDLYENRTGKPVSDASYFITITDMETGEPIMADFFYTEEQSRLELELSNQGERTTVMAAHREQFLNAWMPDDAS